MFYSNQTCSTHKYFNAPIAQLGMLYGRGYNIGQPVNVNYSSNIGIKDKTIDNRI